MSHSAFTLRVLRDPRLRLHHAHILLLFVAPSLPSAIKIRATSDALSLNRSRIRRALALLCELDYLVCLVAPTVRWPGAYALGPACDGGTPWPPIGQRAA